MGNDSETPAVTLSTLKPPRGATQNRKRVGRGPGSGLGKTAGRGHKGHKARSGGATNPGFEGGQMPMYRRLPKRGFHNPAKEPARAINLQQLSRLDGLDVTAESLQVAGLISRVTDRVKLLATGDADRAYVVRGVAVSASARAKIEAAGGRVED